MLIRKYYFLRRDRIKKAWVLCDVILNEQADEVVGTLRSGIYCAMLIGLIIINLSTASHIKLTVLIYDCKAT